MNHPINGPNFLTAQSELSRISRSVFDYSRAKLSYAFFIILIASVLENIGLILILPIAELVFSQGQSANPISQFASAQLTNFGASTIFAQLCILSLGFLLIIILRAYVLLKRDVFLAGLSQGYVNHIRSKLFTALVKADWPTIKRLEQAHLLDGMTTNIGRIAVVIRFVSQVSIASSLVIVFTISAFIINFWVGVVLICIVTTSLLAAFSWTKQSRKTGLQVTETNRDVMTDSTRVLTGLKAAKACHAEANFIANFAGSIENIRALSIKFVSQQAYLRRSVEIIGAVFTIGLLLVGYGIFSLSGSELIILGALTLRVVQHLVPILTGLQNMVFALPAFTASEELIALAQNGSSNETMDDSPPIAVDAGKDAHLVLSDATIVVGELGQEKTLVETGRLTINQNDFVHIKGSSGAGKSTFVELIAGLYLPTSGGVSVGNITLNRQNLKAWQSQISYLAQEPFLFDGSVRENLCWPNNIVSDDQIWAVLRAVRAEQLVRNLPTQLDEKLLDNGHRLSGGERQRLCLARALLRPSKILILDEALSAVDQDIESVILEHLKEISGNKIVLLVSHSSLAEKFADKIIEVKESKLALLDKANSG